MPRYLLQIVCLAAVVSCGTAVATENSDHAGAVGPSRRAATAKPATAETSGTPSAYTPQQAESASSTPAAAATPSPIERSTAVDSSPRRLQLGRTKPTSEAQHPSATRSNNLLGGLADSSAVTALAALAFVAGLFLLFAWFVKRGMPASSQVVPAEAVRILGRVPLGARQFGNLLQLGDKLVLVHVTPSGVEKIAEVDNPQEVERMIALCSKNSSGSSQQEFDEVFGKFAADQTAQGFLGTEASSLSGGRHV